MPVFTVYDSDSGEIIGILEGREDDAALNGAYIAGEYSHEEYVIVEGSPVRKPQSEIDQVELERAWVNFRIIRDGLLSECDWTQVPDAPVDQSAWAAYRQQLRDLPENTTDPANVVWPTKPE